MQEETQVLVKFKTKLPQEYRVPEAPVAVPTKLKRYGLSQVINHLLALDPPRPFDFLINGVLVRKALEQHMLDHQLSPETLVEIEYLPSVIPPDTSIVHPHNDWVSAVDAVESSVLSGSYDGVARLWNGPHCNCSFSAHREPVTAVALLKGGHMAVTGSQDHTARLWQFSSPSSAPTLIGTYQDHGASVTGLAAHPVGDLMCSTCWDGQVRLWRVDLDAVQEDGSGEEGEESGKTKRRKVGSSGQAMAGDAVMQAPVGHLVGHVHCVSSVCWPAEGVIYTGGWDHSVRRWDVETESATDIYHGSKVVHSVASTSINPHLVVFGSSDRTVRAWDTRQKLGESLKVQSHTSHHGWVSSVSWCRGSGHLFVSGSHDKTVKLWDLRSTIPLATMSEHTDKVLCVSGNGAEGILSGGADCQLRSYPLKDSLAVG